MTVTPWSPMQPTYPGTQFLSLDVEAALQTLLTAQLPGVNVDSIGEKDLNDDDQLVFDPPCVRTRHGGTDYKSVESQELTYNAAHIMEVWCCAEDLRSKEAQRAATEALLATVLAIVAGARLLLSDGTHKSEPIRLVGVTDVYQETVGSCYILAIAVPGIAQFPGTNA